MALTLKPFTLKDVSLTLVKGKVAGVGQEYKCQLTQAQLTPAASTTGGGNELETFCEKHTDAGKSLTTWTLDLAGFQAWEDVLDFSRISFNDEGQDYFFTLIPNGATLAPPEGPGPGPSETAPGFEGVVVMVATAVGGTAATTATFTASLPCSSKPTMIGPINVP